MKKIYGFITLCGLLFTAVATAQTMTKIDRDSFSLEYPAGWHLDTDDEDYDPDALFSLDGPGESTLLFMIFQLGLDPDELLDAETQAMTGQLIKNPESVEEFTTWGDLTGKGKIIKGKMLGVFKGKIRLFVWADAHKTVFIMEQYYEKDTEAFEKGIALISKTFRLK